MGPFACNDSTDGNRVPSGLLWSRTSISKLHSEVMNKMSIKLKGFWILLKFVLPQSLTAVSTTAFKLCQDWFHPSTVLSFALKLSPSPSKCVLLFPEHTPNDGSETQHLRITQTHPHTVFHTHTQTQMHTDKQTQKYYLSSVNFSHWLCCWNTGHAKKKALHNLLEDC